MGIDDATIETASNTTGATPNTIGSDRSTSWPDGAQFGLGAMALRNSLRYISTHHLPEFNLVPGDHDVVGNRAGELWGYPCFAARIRFSRQRGYPDREFRYVLIHPKDKRRMPAALQLCPVP